MKGLLRSLLSTAIVAASMVVVNGAQEAHAAVTCPPNLVNTTVKGDVTVVPVVPPQTCLIENSTVKGNVTVRPDAGASIVGSFIDGDLVAKKPDSIRVDALGCGGGGCSDPTLINGNVVISGATATFTNHICNETTIERNLVVKDSAPGAAWAVGPCAFGNTINGQVAFTGNQAFVGFESNTVDGLVTAKENTGGGEVKNNTIGDDLIVRDNTPCWVASGNAVRKTENVQACP